MYKTQNAAYYQRGGLGGYASDCTKIVLVAVLIIIIMIHLYSAVVP